MKGRDIGYWATTGLVALAFSAGGTGNLMRAPAVLETLTTLGYPAYFGTLLGAWKVLGAVAIVAPRLPRLKEWAYAGIVFDLTAAAVSHAAVGNAGRHVVTPLVMLGLALASYWLRPDGRTLKSPASPPADAPAPRAAAVAA